MYLIVELGTNGMRVIFYVIFILFGKDEKKRKSKDK